MYMLKVCRCCDAVIGQLEGEDLQSLQGDMNLEITGNVAYALCPKCLKELEINPTMYYQ